MKIKPGIRNRLIHPIATIGCLPAILLTSVAFGQFQFEQIKSFGFPEQLGSSPSSLIKGSDGALYGTASDVIFKINNDGSGYTILHHGDGGALVEGSDGVLYGASGGGSSGLGVVFALRKDGSDFRVLHNFTGANGDGSHPFGVIEGGDGFLYGTTESGGITTNQFGGWGTVFRIRKDGSSYSVLHMFSFGEGMWPGAPVVQGSDGALYGTTSDGGTVRGGTVFKLKPDGSGYTVLYSLGTGFGDGTDPESALIEGSDGALYGTTAAGGTNGSGTVFKLNKGGTGHLVLHSFAGAGDGTGFVAHGVVEGRDGAMYGTTGGGGTGCGTFFKLNKDGSGFSVLYEFTNGTNGCGPAGAQETDLDDKTFYGVTGVGGVNNSGTAFKINIDGSGYTVLRNFISNSQDPDGHNPVAALLAGSDGFLYGTTLNGGSNQNGTLFKLGNDGRGYATLELLGSQNSLLEGTDGALFGTTLLTVFKLNKNGSGYTALHTFSNTGPEGSDPSGTLIEASDGILYGTAYQGGTDNYGTVFKLNKDGSGFTVLRSFKAVGGDGRYPLAGLVEGSDGILYGTTSRGGSVGGGTVFKLGKDGKGYRVLHDFGSVAWDGGESHAPLLEGSDGALCGTTFYGGTNGIGTVFKLNKDGSGYAVLRSFAGWTVGDGSYPSAGLLEAYGGALYGTTQHGGTGYCYDGIGVGCGTVFRLNKDGSGYATLRRFSDTSGDGNIPYGGLAKASDGTLYGTTSHGGAVDFGTVFLLRPPVTRLTSPAMPSQGPFRFTLLGEPGRRYTIQSSADLIHWIALTNFVSVTGTNQVTDVTNHNCRFYRAVAQ
jgi:hypothetical protein